MYREVFETILFYAALWTDSAHGWLIAGMLSAMTGLAVVAWIMLRTSSRLPIAQFFRFSAIPIERQHEATLPPHERGKTYRG